MEKKLIIILLFLGLIVLGGCSTSPSTDNVQEDPINQLLKKVESTVDQDKIEKPKEENNKLDDSIKCEDYTYSTCPNKCNKMCVSSGCTGDTCTDDCDGKGSCYNPISCHDFNTDTNCICNKDEVRLETALTGEPSVYICKINECTDNNDCESLYGEGYMCYNTDNVDPNKGWCYYGTITN